jgi:hypothetical protein
VNTKLQFAGTQKLSVHHSFFPVKRQKKPFTLQLPQIGRGGGEGRVGVEDVQLEMNVRCKMPHKKILVIE